MPSRNQEFAKPERRSVRDSLLELEIEQGIQLSFSEQSEALEDFAKLLPHFAAVRKLHDRALHC